MYLHDNVDFMVSKRFLIDELLECAAAEEIVNQVVVLIIKEKLSQPKEVAVVELLQDVDFIKESNAVVLILVDKLAVHFLAGDFTMTYATMHSAHLSDMKQSYMNLPSRKRLRRGSTLLGRVPVNCRRRLSDLAAISADSSWLHPTRSTWAFRPKESQLLPEPMLRPFWLCATARGSCS
jgi:hypothetical protein